MDITTNTTACDIVYIHATLHQGDEVHFMDYSRGRQCVANSVVAIALSKICAIKEWTTEHLDSILKTGDVLYQQVRPKEFFDQHPLDNGLLELEDLPVECDIFNRHFEIHNHGSIDCCINVTEIRNCLCSMSQHPADCEAIIVMGDQYGAYASCLIQYNEKIYIFDPHSLSHVTGMPCANGTSVLLVFDNMSKCAEYLVCCANTRHAIQFSMWKLMVTKMQQYQCGDKVLKFPIKTPQINFKPAVTFSKKEYQSTNMKSHTLKIKNGIAHSKCIDHKITHSPIQNKRAKRLNEEYQKSAHATQLKSRYITITSEETIISDKLKCTKYKIKDRQYEILKLQKQIDTHKIKNDSKKSYSYLQTQVNSLQEQIGKLETLVEDLTNQNKKLQEQKKSIKSKVSPDEMFTLDTPNLPKTKSVTRTTKTEYQNLRKTQSSELIREIGQSSQSSEDMNIELHAKQPRYCNYQGNEFDKSMYDKYRKFMKREYMKQKRSSTDYRQKENLKQKEYQAQRRSSTEFRQKENLKQKEYQAQRRSSIEFRQKENMKQKEYKAQRRSCTEFRHKENTKQKEYKAQRRSCTEFRQKENIKQKEYQAQRRSSTEFRQKENIKQKEYQAQKRSSTEFRQKENMKQKE